MKVLIDANVLFPTVMREVVLGVAGQGLFQPLWSPRILEEWARAAARLGPVAEAQARGEIAQLGAAWPRALVRHPPELEARLWLPDPNDVHVLAAAIHGSADIILPVNAKDFPRNILAAERLSRVDMTTACPPSGRAKLSNTPTESSLVRLASVSPNSAPLRLNRIALSLVIVLVAPTGAPLVAISV